MKYTLELDIAAPRDKLVRLFADHAHLAKWQPDLLDIELVQGDPWTTGAKTKLRHRMGKSEIEMVETVTRSGLPEILTCTYEAKKVWNEVTNRFEVIDAATTRWTLTSEFRCGGMMRIMVMLVPSMFKKESQKYMDRFKRFVENVLD